MTSLKARSMGKLLAGTMFSIGLIAAAPAFAQEVQATARAGAQPSASAPSTSAMTNLIRLLVQNKVISQDAADALTRQAEAEAVQARAAQPAGPAQTQQAALPPPAQGSVRVAYVPETVKNQIRDEVRAEVLDEVKNERWALPNLVPDWVSRIEWSGDLRVRDQQDLYGNGNVGSGGQDGLIDYAAFNGNGPTDINPITNPNGIPLLNTTRDRNSTQLRARLAMLAHVEDRVDVGIRIATGSTNSPVSTNQALGGGLSKKDLWLDQAFVDLRPADWATITLGRMPNPFMSTDLVYDDDLNFDGVAAKYGWNVGGDAEGFGVKGVFGAFPLDYVSNPFPSNSSVKEADRTKWLLAAQLEGDWRSEKLNARLGVAYYDFHDIQGQLSDPCYLYTGIKQCSSDPSRPAFMQKGNTLFLLRSIVPDPANPLNFAQPQFVGLSMDYKLLDLNLALDWNAFGPYHLTLVGDYVRNLAYDAKDICRYHPEGIPVNNVQPGLDSAFQPVWFDPCTAPPAGISAAKFQSGPNGWMAKATFGYPKTRAWGEWNVSVGYKYLQPDAVVDGYTDSDFHLGGTNAQGYFIAGSLGLFNNTWLTARWLSANEVYGPPLQIDVGQVDLNIAF